MRVCYLNHDISDKTGAGRFFNSLIDAIKKTAPDFQYEILTHSSGLPKKFWQLPFYFFRIRQTFKNCDVIHALDGWPYGVIASLAMIGLKKAKNNIRTSDVQNIDINMGTSEVQKLDRPKLIITAIGTGAVQPLYSWWKRPIMKWAYRRADIVTAVSNATKREIHFFLPDLKIEVINHGVDYEKFESILRTSDVQKIDGNIGTSDVQRLKPYILSVGTLKKRKGYEYSIQAFAEVAKKFPNFKYVIVGKGLEREALESRIKNYELRGRVLFLENVTENELIELYKNAELFILMPQDINKDIEGFGLVFLEAAACGLPVIASKNTSAEDAVENGETGILVEPQDFLGAAAAIEKILSDKSLREKMSEESLKFSREMNWGKAAMDYIKLYR